MSLQSFKEMLDNLEGEYTLNFAQKDDCEYFLEKYGGEDALRRKYPAIYDNFNRTRQAAEQAALKYDGAADEPNICPGMLYGLDVAPLKSRAGMMPGASLDSLDSADSNDQYVCLSSLIGFDFIDKTKKVSDKAAAEEWIGVTVETTVKEVNSPLYLIDDNFVLPKAHSFHDYVESAPDKLCVLNNRRYSMKVEVTGVEPSGSNVSKIFTKTFTVGTISKRTISDIKIEDPVPKSAAHIKSEEIMMLYGRLDQLAIYADADYKDGDFLNNTFSDGKVRLLMPLKGNVIYNVGVKPLGLYEPVYEAEALLRPRVTYDNKDKSFEYYGSNKDDKAMYAKMKGCFSQGEYRSDVPSKVTFDFKIADTGRSGWDWHIDLDGLANATGKTVYLDQGFTYSSKNQLEKTVNDQITIKSITKEGLKQINRKYYEFVPGVANVVYIPPIVIYWGCFGRDTRIRLADKTEKSACDIVIGDKLAGYDGKILTVDNVLVGHDATICLINTKDHGSIKVSGGHPMLCGGEKIRACEIAPGDRLDMPGSEFAEVISVETIEYNDAVYNFTFEGEDSGVYLIANGFYSGDLRMQNEQEKAPERIFTQNEKQIIAETVLYNEELKAKKCL